MLKKNRSRKHHTVCSLIEGLECIRRKGDGSSEVTGLITDSRRVMPGTLFFAIEGLRTNGHFYIEEAVDRGAVAVVSEQDQGKRFPIDFIQVEDIRETLAAVSRLFYEKPDERMSIAGITGTNGKTTVSVLAQHLLGGDDQVGLIGTIRYDIGRRTLPSFRTTPESVDLYAMLAQMVAGGCQDAVMEVSSHGIDQKRVFGIDFDVVAFLNLTQDHLDYHKSMEAYYEVKKKLFVGDGFALPRAVVINADCPYGQRLIKESPERIPIVTFGFDESAAIRARDVELLADRTVFELIWPEGRARVASPLLGRYNVSNFLAALAIGRAKGYAISRMLPRLANFSGVTGRMERIDCGQSYNVLVDYAHTDDALKHACAMLREVTKGKLIVVFGCGGDRDRTKRAPMMRAVFEGADRVYVTADNPRSESLERIFGDMREALGSDEKNRVVFTEDRKRAISLALDAAHGNDCVLIAGKGHETYQEFNGTVIPFNDRLVACELIRIKSLMEEVDR